MFTRGFLAAAVMLSAACETRAETPRTLPPAQSAVASAAVTTPRDSAAPPAEERDALTEQIPEALQGSLLGCWATGVEEWRVGREAGVLVVRRRLPEERPEATRAALPATLLYSPHGATFGFTSAGPVHELLFVLQREGDVLSGQVYTRRAPGERYRWTGNSVRAERCQSDGGGP